MPVHAVALALLPLLFALAPAVASATDAATRAAEERALRAQIDRTDHDIQALVSRRYELEKTHPGDPQIDALRAQIHAMDRDQELIEKRLHELEAERARDGSGHRIEEAQAPPARIEPRELPVAEPMVPPPPPPPPPTLPDPPMAQAPRVGAPIRQAADPAVYAKALGDNVGVFRYRSYKWVPVGVRQVAIYNTYDDAYLLDLAIECPGLLSTDRLKVENFSTKVKAGRDGVIADGQRCPITAVHQLNVARLPR